MELEKLIMNEKDRNILKEILQQILHLQITDIKFEKNLELNDISEYEFELIKIRANLENNENVEIYLKMVKRSRIKESIFCYWCTIYEEESNKLDGESGIILNKVLISELTKKKYQQSIFLEIENNKLPILETGTEVNFLDIINYIREYKNEINQYEDLEKYFCNKPEEMLLIGIKMKRDKRNEQ